MVVLKLTRPFLDVRLASIKMNNGVIGCRFLASVDVYLTELVIVSSWLEEQFGASEIVRTIGVATLQSQFSSIAITK